MFSALLAATPLLTALYYVGVGALVLGGTIIAISAFISIRQNIKNGGIHPLEQEELDEIARLREEAEREALAGGEAGTARAANEAKHDA